MSELLNLFLVFAKVGVTTFGGGYAMLPILQREIVEARGWATEEEILDMLHRKEFVLYKTSFISLLFFLRNHNGAFTHKDPTKIKK